MKEQNYIVSIMYSTDTWKISRVQRLNEEQ